MDLVTLAYLFLAFVAVLGAAMVVFTRDTVHSAMSLVGVMIALTGLFLLMRQEFIAMIQLIVYAGAIMVLFLFVIMLLNMRQREEAAWTLRRIRFWGGVLALVFFFVVGVGAYQFATVVGTPSGGGLASRGVNFSVAAIARLMLTDWLLPFELTAVLLLVAMVGALIMARRLPEESQKETAEGAGSAEKIAAKG